MVKKGKGSMMKCDLEKGLNGRSGAGRLYVQSLVMCFIFIWGVWGINPASGEMHSFDVRSFDLRLPADGRMITDTRRPTFTWEQSYVIDNVLVNEDLTDKPSGRLVKAAHYQPDKQALRLTEAVSRTRGAIEYQMNPGARFAVQFDLWVGEEGGGGETFFYAYNNKTPKRPGFPGGGYTFGFDNYHGKIELNWNGKEIASAQAGSWKAGSFADASWHDVVIVVAGRRITLYLDGEKKLSHADKKRDRSGRLMGFGARCGGAKSEQRVRNLKVAQFEPVDHYEVFVDGSKVGTVESTLDDDPRSYEVGTVDATSYQVEPLSYGEHTWNVVSVTEEGDRTKMDRTGNISVQKGVSVALAGQVKADNPEYLRETLQTWKTDLRYPGFEFSAHVGGFVAGSRPQVRPTETAIKDSVTWYTDHLSTFSTQVLGMHDVSDWEERPDKPYKAAQSVMNEAGMPARTFAFEYDNVLFINLGTAGGPGRMAKKVLAWLESITARYPDKPTVILAPFASGQLTRGGRKKGYEHFQEEREDITHFWKEFLSQEQIVGWFHGMSGDVSEYSLEDHHEVLYGNMVETGMPGFGSEADTSRYSGYVNIVRDAIHVNIWDEEKDEMTAGKVESGYDLDVGDEGFGSIFVPRFVQDGEEWSYTNYFGATELQLNLIGTEYTDLAYNNYFNKYITDDAYPVGNPGCQGGAQGDGEAMFNGQEKLRLADTGTGGGTEDPAVSWIKIIPGKTYQLSVWIKGETEEDDVLDVTMKYSEGSVNSFSSQESLFENLDVTGEYTKHTTQFTVPSNPDLWRGQLVWEASGENEYYMDRYVLTRGGTGTTEDFEVTFNGEKFSAEKALEHNEVASFDIDPALLERVSAMKASISGNRVGVVEIAYNNPVFYSQHAAAGIEEVAGNQLEVKFERVAQHNETTSYFPLCDLAKTSVPGNDEFKQVFYEIPNASFMFSSEEGLREKTFTIQD
mgnify:CR=1 FL=1